MFGNEAVTVMVVRSPERGMRRTPKKDSKRLVNPPLTRYSLPMTKPVNVSKWGELRAEKPVPRTLRIVVGVEAAGGVTRNDDGTYTAWHYGKNPKWKADETTHPTADAAVKRVLRSGLARRLGATAQSPVNWTVKARRVTR